MREMQGVLQRQSRGGRCLAGCPPARGKAGHGTSRPIGCFGPGMLAGWVLFPTAQPAVKKTCGVPEALNGSDGKPVGWLAVAGWSAVETGRPCSCFACRVLRIKLGRFLGLACVSRSSGMPSPVPVLGRRG